MYRYGLPIAFKAFGIPHGACHGTFSSNIFINIPKTLVDAGAPNIEWSVTLPDYVVSSLKSKFSGIVIGYGNYFGLFSCKDGLIKDSSEVNEILQPIRDAKYICLWRK